MQAWQPAAVNRGELPAAPLGCRVAFAPIGGPPELATRLSEAIEATRPAGSPHLTRLPQLAAGLPPQPPGVIPASHQQLLEAVSPLHAARQQNADWLIQGSITHAELGEEAQPFKPATPNSPGAALAVLQRMTATPDETSERLIVSWEAVEVASGRTVQAATISFNRQQVEKEYPDLLLVQDPVDRLLRGVSRETWSHFAATLEPTDVELQQPWVSSGSSEVRRGNAAAKEGLWQLAETHWQTAAGSHPRNKAAWYNLAMASAAREDFELARLQLSKAKPMLPSKSFREAELWLDSQQKAYHRVFSLPPREGGWLQPDPPMAPPMPSEPTAVAPTDVEDLPWWTAIPFTKPPGWTWKAWLSQPLP